MTTTNAPQIRKVEFNFRHPELYNPIYLPTLYNRSPFIHLYGSAGSGKSRWGCQKEIIMSFQEYRRGKRTLVGRRYQNTLYGSVYSELLGVIEDWGLDKYFDISKSPMRFVNKITRVEFVFRGFDDVEKIKSIPRIDRALIEEATDIDRFSDIDQLDTRIRGVVNGQITLMYNPVNVFHWLNQEIHEVCPPGHYILKTTFRDNLRLLDFEKRNNISPTYAEKLEAKKARNPNFWKVYGLGEWGNNPEGLIYDDYITVGDMPLVQAYGLDFGNNDPTALVATAVEDTFNQDKKSFYVKELLYETRLSVNDIIAALNRLQIRKDVPIIADNSRPEVIADIQRAGYWVIPCHKYKGSVSDGISRVKKYKLKLVAGSKNLTKEVSNYCWANKKGEWLEDPEDGLDHLCDAFRYASEYLDKDMMPDDIPFTSHSYSLFGRKR